MVLNNLDKDTGGKAIPRGDTVPSIYPSYADSPGGYPPGKEPPTEAEIEAVLSEDLRKNPIKIVTPKLDPVVSEDEDEE